MDAPKISSLTTEDLGRMKDEHIEDQYGDCVTCRTADPWDNSVRPVPFPCDAALLLAHLARLQIQHHWPGLSLEENRRHAREAREYLAQFDGPERT